MANVDNPNGFVPIGTLGASGYNGGGRWYYAPTSSATAIFKNDLVAKVTNSATGTANIKAVTAGGTILGSAQAFTTVDPKGDPTSLAGPIDIPFDEYRAAGVAGWVLVTDDPFMIYKAQCTSAVGTADIGKNFDVTTGAGSTATFTSAHEINSTSVATATAQIRVIELDRQADGNNTLSSNATVICMINEHFYKATTGV